MSISVSGVTKIYGTQKALNDVSFEVKIGEIVGFLGPNGAGKSTMMKIISGFIPPTFGQIEVCGLNVQEKEMEVKRKLGYLPENNPLYYEMYIKEYLEFVAGLYNFKEKKDRIADIIELVGLSKEQQKKIGELSKGYKQRVGLAQAFIHNPEVLILDEPTTGLDPNQIVEIRQLIKNIGKDKTVMLSTHIMQEVEAICDRAIIINEGEIVADKEIADLKRKDVGSGKLIVEFNKQLDNNLLTKHFGAKNYIAVGGNKYEFINDALSTIRKKIMQLSIDQEVEIISMQESSANLEDVFRELTKKKI